MEKLSDLPNVGRVLEKNLMDVGIETPEQLRTIGCMDTFKRIRKLDAGACLHMLYGIQGAIENIKDTDLSKETKLNLKYFYNDLNKEEAKLQ